MNVARGARASLRILAGHPFLFAALGVMLAVATGAIFVGLGVAMLPWIVLELFAFALSALGIDAALRGASWRRAGALVLFAAVFVMGTTLLVALLVGPDPRLADRALGPLPLLDALGPLGVVLATALASAVATAPFVYTVPRLLTQEGAQASLPEALAVTDESFQRDGARDRMEALALGVGVALLPTVLVAVLVGRTLTRGATLLGIIASLPGVAVSGPLAVALVAQAFARAERFGRTSPPTEMSTRRAGGRLIAGVALALAPWWVSTAALVPAAATRGAIVGAPLASARRDGTELSLDVPRSVLSAALTGEQLVVRDMALDRTSEARVPGSVDRLEVFAHGDTYVFALSTDPRDGMHADVADGTAGGDDAPREREATASAKRGWLVMTDGAGVRIDDTLRARIVEGRHLVAWLLMAAALVVLVLALAGTSVAERRGTLWCASIAFAVAALAEPLVRLTS